MLLPLLSEEAEALTTKASFPRGSEDADVEDGRGRKPNGNEGKEGKEGKGRSRMEDTEFSQPAANTLGVLVACRRLLAHSPGMCHLHPLLTSLSFASCVKRKPAQIWPKNLTDRCLQATRS